MKTILPIEPWTLLSLSQVVTQSSKSFTIIRPQFPTAKQTLLHFSFGFLVKSLIFSLFGRKTCVTIYLCSGCFILTGKLRNVSKEKIFLGSAQLPHTHFRRVEERPWGRGCASNTPLLA